ncbi:homoserine kinase [Dolichospermum circinale CS-1225]|uniref:Homoserine kinase n=1 Tax=Dolichospermum circinale CS-537/01 TaxID=3021739 RepID=A0ABT5AAQ8_9CYAN|nr:homoserine kinase [Dolichospermum circinale]MDB9459197.1 homoserine kinase [Dolichospermum circinale CS-545/17]MDB9468347.1 homoserine kinase [Dolichospermum circinale CS-539/09]MDB9471932.1 homoserine kinase [Dolichospermum circinale CS-539]MDB9488625.1 homoserine kinase [Dolichospermum circinale CS-537/01]MDB9520406.1 homoserine kinase [Dolichospermum circinale CS-1225]
MAVFSHITVKVPATTANLGPGFDCIGAALKLYNEFEFTTLNVDGLMIQVSGMEAEKVQTDESNLLYQAFIKLYQHIEQTAPSVKIRIKLGVPLSRGLGSSATAIIAGLVAANELAGQPLSEFEVMKLAIAMEGHPDNVVPALLGGCRLAATSNNCWEIGDIPWHRDIVPVVAIPDFELSTSQARKVLPADISRDDAIFNISHFGLLLRGLATNREEWLKAALQDKLHQPYRQALIPGYDVVNNAAINAGAYGMVISGAGPTLLALVDTSRAKLVEIAMKNAWLQTGITSTVRIVNLDMQGTTTF